MLLQAEEDRDVEAAKVAKAEQVAELAEFDELYHSDIQVKFIIAFLNSDMFTIVNISVKVLLL